MKKMGLSVKSAFQGSINKDSRFQRKILMKKDFSFEEVFFFCYHFWSFSNFFVFLQRCLANRCVKLPVNVRKEKNWEINPENLFFFNSILESEEKKLRLSSKQ